jgi:hypothetical protein
MEMQINRTDLHTIRCSEPVARDLEVGQARFAISTYGITANNITYAVFGDMMQYWEFFPTRIEADRGEWGVMPVWGFADVVESKNSALAVGTRVFGYFPFGSELIVEPGRFDDSGFNDMAPHRQKLPTVYNRYAYTSTDKQYSVENEPYILLLRPLFTTSFVMNDFLVDHDFFGATTIIVSSASAKTSLGSVVGLRQTHGSDLRIVGLTSLGNLEFCQSLACYDEVLTYDQVRELPLTPSVYVDVAGRRDVTFTLHAHFGNNLKYSMIVGDTHWDNHDEISGDLAGPKPEFLFAPVQIAKRRTDWGRDGFEDKISVAWDYFVEWVKNWLVILPVTDDEASMAAYRAVLEGSIDPATGYVVTQL